ncbi:MFS transporter [Methylocystis sp. ATCC 49242]|uniref:MFS transporter n=1 Tax=Methylocystis sp. ATCC 49242 TaxID=622637 RepID=UPI0005618E9E|nr:MFS transporter [Methylocystis sp. ATCC 49242]
MSPAPLPRGPLFGAIDQAPMNWRHYMLWLAASGGAFLGGFTVVALGLAVPLLKQDFSLGPLVIGFMGAALVVGAAASGSIGGVLADKFGRKRVMVIDMAVVILAALLGAFASDPWMLVAAQLLSGAGVGADFPASATYVSETMPARTRARMIVATIGTQSVGMVTAALAGMAILKFHPAASDWRLLVGASGVIASLYFLARLRAPESLRWLATKGRVEEARALLSQLGAPARDAAMPDVAAAPAQPTAPPPAQPSLHGAGLGTLFSARYRARTLLVSLPWLLMDVATYGVGLFTPVIVGAFHVDGASGGLIASDFTDAEGSAVVDLFQMDSFLASIWAVPIFGRIFMQIAGFAGMAIGMTLLLFAAVANDGPMMHMSFVFGGFVLFNFAMNAGPNATTFTLAPTLFPTAIRASASGFAAGAAKVGATAGVFVVPQLQAAWGLDGVVALMALVSLAGLAATAWFAHAVNDEGALEED